MKHRFIILSLAFVCINGADVRADYNRCMEEMNVEMHCRDYGRFYTVNPAEGVQVCKKKVDEICRKNIPDGFEFSRCSEQINRDAQTSWNTAKLENWNEALEFIQDGFVLTYIVRYGCLVDIR